MKQKIIFTTIFAIVMLNALTLGANITISQEYRSSASRNAGITVLSQNPEHNISSYMDYVDASLDVMIGKHMNLTTGVVFHEVTHNLHSYIEETSLSSYYWMIAALSNAYQHSNNETYKIAMSRAANKMVSLFKDPTYPGFYVNQYSDLDLRQTKRPGVQAYAYWALDIAESTNVSLDFTIEKESALRCLTEMLYDPIHGGFFFYTMRNGSLNIPANFDEVYPNDGKRLDHLVLAATVLYDAGVSLGNTTLLNMADNAMSFMLMHFKYYHDMIFMGLKLAVNRTGGVVVVAPQKRVAHSVVTDLNAMAIRALVKGYETTGNTTYLDMANQVFETLFTYNWDGESGGWYAEVVDGEPYDPLDDEDVKYYKYAEIQFHMILALEELYEATDSIYPIRMVIDNLELLLGHLWDVEDGGFMSTGNQDWEVFNDDWMIHYTIVQAQAILCLERAWSYGLPIVTQVRISPTDPRPEDIIYFSATVLDDDGIDSVYVNYTMNEEGNETNGILPLLANLQIGGLYNNSMGNIEDGTQVNFDVFANDTTGRTFVAGSYYFIVRTDIFAPIAELHAIYPTSTIRVGDDVIVDIETFEFPIHSHTNSCELRWRLNAGTYTTVNMTPIGVEDDRIIWRYVLGQFNGGDQIAFFALATDEAGNIGESRLYQLTILGPAINITPFTVFQIVATVGLIAAPGVGYAYTRMQKRNRGEAQREGKKAARKRAKRRGPRRRA
ncbi:MAG: hypothetical protein ACXAEF_13240 [Candidatus Thorarchaeota archaeon]|jgi:hypothetical protein